MGQCQGRFGENIIYFMCVITSIYIYINMPPAYRVFYMYILNGCRHTFYVISFNKATHHFTMPYNIYNRNLYYVLNGCYYYVMYNTFYGMYMYNKTYPHQIYISTISFTHILHGTRSNHLGMYNKIHKSSGSIFMYIIQYLCTTAKIYLCT